MYSKFYAMLMMSMEGGFTALCLCVLVSVCPCCLRNYLSVEIIDR